MRPIVAIAFLFLFATAVPQAASAQTCSFNVSDMDFGNVDTLGGGAVSTTATIDIECGGALALTSVQICLDLNAGSGGATGGERHMRNAGNDPLDYVLYQDPAHLVPWGSSSTPSLGTARVVELLLPALFGTTSTSVTIYGEVSAGQQTAVPGSFNSLFAGIEAEFKYDFDFVLPLGDCSDADDTANPSFSVLADVSENCEVVAGDIAFGTHGVLDTNIDAVGAIDVTCTPGTDFGVGLDGGLAGAPPDQRLLTQGAQTVTYGLFKNPARDQVWGNAGGETVTGTGTGGLVPLTVYGRVFAQSTPPPGTYTDMVVVTVTY